MYLPDKMEKVCREGNLTEFQKLLKSYKNHTNLSINDKYGEGTLLHIACKYGHIKIVELLLKKKIIDVNKNAPLCIACKNGHIQIVRLLLLDDRVDINQNEVNGNSPLYIACENGNFEIVIKLLEFNKIDINKINNEGATPLHSACKNGHKSIVNKLLEYSNNNKKKLNINAMTKKDETPLDISISNKKWDIVILLEENSFKRGKRTKNKKEYKMDPGYKEAKNKKDIFNAEVEKFVNEHKTNTPGKGALPNIIKKFGLIEKSHDSNKLHSMYSQYVKK